MGMHRERQERLYYISSNWDNTRTWEDVYAFADMFGVTVSEIHKDLQLLGLTFLTKKEVAIIKREKYLKEVWSKKSREIRESVEDLAIKFNVSVQTIVRDIKRLGLNNARLTKQELDKKECKVPRNNCNGTGYIKDYIEDLDYSSNSDSISYDELNSLLGVGAGTYREDNWGKYGY